jgi:hypothetical protein
MSFIVSLFEEWTCLYYIMLLFDYIILIPIVVKLYLIIFYILKKHITLIIKESYGQIKDYIIDLYKFCNKEYYKKLNE